MDNENAPIKYYENAFDLLRLICAMQVLFGHYVEHFKLYNVANCFDNMLQISQFVPGRGVIVFFAISGYLAVRSVEKSSDFIRYAIKKVKRIYPELIIAFLINTIIICIVYKIDCSVKDFLIYSLTQLTIFQFYTGDWLRGYGAGTANGALWTISVIIQFYVLSFFLINYISKCKKRCIYLYLIAVGVSVIGSNCNHVLPIIAYKLFTVSVFPYLHIFLLGVFCYYYNDKIFPLIKRNWILILIIYVLVRCLVIEIISVSNWNFGVNYDVFSAMLLSILTIGTAYILGNIHFRYEISYGIYIYHMIYVNIGLEMLYKFGWENQNVVLVATLAFLATLITSLMSNIYTNRLLHK